MPGIYLHIPFCHKACHYCDFHFSTDQTYKKKMVEVMAKEIDLQKAYLKGESIETIYFGGGTPSTLSAEDIKILLATIQKNFKVEPSAEITLEANPDDMQTEYLQALKHIGINRLSIGIQSFNDTILSFLNRNHNALAAKEAVAKAKESGITNISIDLIYGIPSKDHSILLQDIEMAMALDIDHISAYCLSIEPKTVFGNWLKKGKLNNPDEDFNAEQFEILTQTLSEHGYEQYEISNFCRNKHYSKHNTNYWRAIHYLGIGPGAHSFNGQTRHAAISNNAQYIKKMEEGILPITIEHLSRADQFNEYLLTTLRTKWGCDIGYLEEEFPENLDEFKKCLNTFVLAEVIVLKENHVLLTKKGKLLADEITAKLMIS